MPVSAQVGALASGYIYYVSLKGVTGSAALDVAAVAARIPEIRARTGVPVGVGFGIRDAATAAAVAAIADAVVVGSRIIEEIEQSPPRSGLCNVLALVADIRRGMDGHECPGRNDMGWLNKLLPPKIKRNDSGVARRSSLPEGLWSKCPACEAVLYATDLANNCNVCPKCGHHKRLESRARIDLLLDAEGRCEIGSEVLPVDSLSFKDSRRYPERLQDATEATGETDALVVVSGSIKTLPVVLAVFEFDFMGGSMGSVLGERFVRGVQAAVDRRGRSSVSPLRAVRACRRGCFR
jgi:hypothetical protein